MTSCLYRKKWLFEIVILIDIFFTILWSYLFLFTNYITFLVVQDTDLEIRGGASRLLDKEVARGAPVSRKKIFSPAGLSLDPPLLRG